MTLTATTPATTTADIINRSQLTLLVTIAGKPNTAANRIPLDLTDRSELAQDVDLLGGVTNIEIVGVEFADPQQYNSTVTLLGDDAHQAVRGLDDDNITIPLGHALIQDAHIVAFELSHPA